MKEFDLSKETEGISTFRNGLKLWSHIRKEQGSFFLRLEDGWYYEFNAEGKIIGDMAMSLDKDGNVIEVHPAIPEFDIVDFHPCGIDEAMELLNGRLTFMGNPNA